MPTVGQYAQQIQQMARPVARQMGLSIAGSDKPTRIIVRLTIGIIAVLVKLLVDKGVFTDQEWSDALTAAVNGTYADEPAQPDPPFPPG